LEASIHHAHDQSAAGALDQSAWSCSAPAASGWLALLLLLGYQLCCCLPVGPHHSLLYDGALLQVIQTLLAAALQ
jgi:hypothetical protein